MDKIQNLKKCREFVTRLSWSDPVVQKGYMEIRKPLEFIKCVLYANYFRSQRLLWAETFAKSKNREISRILQNLHFLIIKKLAKMARF